MLNRKYFLEASLLVRNGEKVGEKIRRSKVRRRKIGEAKGKMRRSCEVDDDGARVGSWWGGRQSEQ